MWGVQGMNDAIMWSRKGSKAFEWDEHWVLIATRATYVVYGIVLFLTGTGTDTLFMDILVYNAIGFFWFPFFHNGMYYLQRNEINKKVYGKRWWANPSATTTAPINFKLWLRVTLLIAGFVILVLYKVFT